MVATVSSIGRNPLFTLQLGKRLGKDTTKAPLGHGRSSGIHHGTKKGAAARYAGDGGVVGGLRERKSQYDGQRFVLRVHGVFVILCEVLCAEGSNQIDGENCDLGTHAALEAEVE